MKILDRMIWIWYDKSVFSNVVFCTEFSEVCKFERKFGQVKNNLHCCLTRFETHFVVVELDMSDGFLEIDQHNVENSDVDNHCHFLGSFSQNEQLLHHLQSILLVYVI